MVCSDVVEHLLDPTFLLNLLTACYRRGAFVITSTPDRILVRGVEHKGPPPNRSHIREWALSEYISLLSDFSLPATFYGYTINNNIDRKNNTIITIHDPEIQNAALIDVFQRPLAILTAYNEADVIREVIIDLVEQGCDVKIIDNWSTDKTWNIIEELTETYPAAVSIERFPAEGHCDYYEWGKLLQRKTEIASHFIGRWIIHTDADEIRRSPFPHMTIATALHLAQHCGANRVNFNLINFRPTSDVPFSPGTLQTALSHFEFGTRPGHFKQGKAWLQGKEAVDLSSSGGHVANFSGAVDFRYKFLLKHYPIRSQEHGRRKVMHERHGRWSPEERSMGWHVQYDDFSNDSSYVWRQEQLLAHTQDFWIEHGLAIMTDIMER